MLEMLQIKLTMINNMKINILLISIVLVLALVSCNERTIQKETEATDTTIDTTDAVILSKVDSIKSKSKVTKEDQEIVPMTNSLNTHLSNMYGIFIITI